MEVVYVPVVDEAFPLQKVDEHQTIEQDRGVPAPLLFVRYALDKFDKSNVLAVEFLVKALGNTLDVEGVAEPPGDLHQGHVAGCVELADVENYATELAEEKVARLSLDVEMITREVFAILSLHPAPNALGTCRVQENQQVLVVD